MRALEIVLNLEPDRGADEGKQSDARDGDLRRSGGHARNDDLTRESFV